MIKFSQPIGTTSELRTMLPATARITIGSYVCLCEGVFATISTLIPQNHWFVIASLVVAFAFWAGADQFRGYSKVCADVSELFFYDLLVFAIAAGFYFAGIHPWLAVYVTGGLSVLKMIRLYMPRGTVTNEQGWGVFGLMTYLDASANTAKIPAQMKWAMYRALFLASLVAVGGALLLMRATHEWRLAFAWLVPLFFEITVGPRQLGNLRHFVQAFMASQASEAAKDEKIAELTQQVATLTSTDPANPQQQLPPDVLAAFTAAYYQAEPAVRKNLIEYAQTVAEGFPAQKP